MNKMLKTFITCGISILFLSATLHVDLNDHKHYGGYSICDIGCGEKDHYSINHQCEKCLNKNNRLLISYYFDLSINQDVLYLYSLDENFKYSFLNFSLYSRPPPSLL